ALRRDAGSPGALGARSAGLEGFRILAEIPDVAGFILGKVVVGGLDYLLALFDDVRHDHARHAIDVDRLIGDGDRVGGSVAHLVEPGVAHREGHELVVDRSASFKVVWVECYVDVWGAWCDLRHLSLPVLRGSGR